MRPFLHLLFLLLPFVAFWLYVRFAVGYRERHGESFNKSHWYWVTLVALVLFGASFFILSGGRVPDRGGVYVPPRVEDGKIVPGHVEPRAAEEPEMEEEAAPGNGLDVPEAPEAQ